MPNMQNRSWLKTPDPGAWDFLRQHRFSFNPYIGIPGRVKLKLTNIRFSAKFSEYYPFTKGMIKTMFGLTQI